MHTVSDSPSSDYGKALKLWLYTNVLGTVMWLVYVCQVGGEFDMLSLIGFTAASVSLVTVPVTVYAFRTIKQLPPPQRPWIAAAIIIGLFLLPTLLLGTVIEREFELWLIVFSVASPYLAAALVSATLVYWKVLFAASKKVSETHR